MCKYERRSDSLFVSLVLLELCLQSFDLVSLIEILLFKSCIVRSSLNEEGINLLGVKAVLYSTEILSFDV